MVAKVTVMSIEEKCLILTGDAPHMLENWVMALIHPSLSIYPDGVGCNVQYSGMLKWRSWEYSLDWL